MPSPFEIIRAGDFQGRPGDRPERRNDPASEANDLASMARERPIVALNKALSAIGNRYGRATADFVALTLEYPRSDAAR